MVVIQIFLSAFIIGLSTFLARKYPVTAGFVVGAIPLSTALTLVLIQLEHQDTERTVLVARSVLVAMLLSVSFFIPYLAYAKWKLNFWVMYATSITLVILMYPLHQKIMSYFEKS